MAFDYGDLPPEVQQRLEELAERIRTRVDRMEADGAAYIATRAKYARLKREARREGIDVSDFE